MPIILFFFDLRNTLLQSIIRIRCYLNFFEVVLTCLTREDGIMNSIKKLIIFIRYDVFFSFASFNISINTFLNSG